MRVAAPLLLCFACRPGSGWGPVQALPWSRDTDAPPHTGDSEHTGDSHDSEDSTPPGPPDFIEVALDSETHLEDDFEISTWQLNPDAPDQYSSLFDGESPMFYFGRPMNPSGDPVPIIVWFHGGTIGDDSAGELPLGCTADAVTGYADKTVNEDFLPLVLAARAGWGFLVPRNDWCDYWTGLGPDDPVDSERHFGYYHARRVLDFVLSDAAGLDASGVRYGWGTSAGGGAVVHVANKYGGFAGIVSDSAPGSMLLYYASDPGSLEHIMGGPPYDDGGKETEFYARYAEASADWLVEEGGLRVPIYVTWNTLDGLVSPPQPKRLIAALESAYEPEDARWGQHDFNHAAPGDYYHTQSKWPQVPWGYTGLALQDFLSGDEISWMEVEDGCDGDLAATCDVGVITTSADSDLALDFSQATVREARATDGAGTLWAANVPADLPTGVAMTATLVMQMRGLETESAGQVVGKLSWVEGSTRVDRTLKVEDFSPSSDATHAENLHQYATTSVGFVNGGEGQLSYKVYGKGRTQLDAIIFNWAADAD